MLDEGSARVAGLLKSKGLEPGDRVGLMLPNVPYFPVIYYGILRAGGIVVPMNVLLKGREVGFYLEDPGAKIVFAWGDFAEAAEAGAETAGAETILVKPGEFEKLLAEQEADHDVAEKAADDTAVILYTSGTTGTPKGAELTHSNLYKNSAGVSREARRAQPGRRAARCAAAVPLVRPDLHDEQRSVCGRHRDDAAALRPRQGARDHRPRHGHDLPGRSHDVQRHAALGDRATARTAPRCAPACRAERRCRPS